MNQTNVDIGIVGGGMVGLTMAAALSSSGLKIALIDQQRHTADASDTSSLSLPFSPRVSALTMASIGYLDGLGLWSAIHAKQPCAFSSMRVWDAEGTGSIHFDAAEVYHDALGYITENQHVTQALEAFLVEQENVAFIQGTVAGLSEEKLTITIKEGCEEESEQSLTSRLIIGADGGRSFIRELAGFEQKQWAYGHQAIVTTVQIEQAHQETAWQCFHETGPLAFLPLMSPAGSSEHFASIVWSCVPELCEALMGLDDQAFADRLGKAFENKLGKVLKVNPRHAFPLNQQHATDYVKPGIALVGDAAHTIHPLAGQGVNLGFQDVQTLAEVIIDAQRRKQDFADIQVLSRYQRQRKGHNLGMMTAMEGFKRLFERKELSLTWLRNAGMSGIDHLPVVKKQIMKQAMGLS